MHIWGKEPTNLHNPCVESSWRPSMPLSDQASHCKCSPHCHAGHVDQFWFWFSVFPQQDSEAVMEDGPLGPLITGRRGLLARRTAEGMESMRTGLDSCDEAPLSHFRHRSHGEDRERQGMVGNWVRRKWDDWVMLSSHFSFWPSQEAR